MAKKNLLLVDQDPKSRRVLEVSLRKAGFIVTTATNGSDALEKVATSPPDLIISDTRMGVMDGFEFCRRLKDNPEWAGIPFIFLTNQKSVEDKIRGLELGVEDYLTKPIYIKEIITRVKILLQRKEREDLETKDSKTRFEGTLADMTVVDLIQTVEIAHKTGVLRFEHPNGQQGAIYLRNGQVIDAEVGRLQGEQAVYRILTWSEGRFEVEFRPIHRKQVIDMSPQALLLEGMRRLDEWGRLNEQLPSMDAVFEVDYRELAERLAGLPDEVNSVLKLFDGRRNLLSVLDHSEYDDLETLNIISKLYFEGLIYDATQGATAAHSTDAPPLEGWLRDPEAAAAALGTSSVEHSEPDSSKGRKKRNTKRGLGALKEPPPPSLSVGRTVDSDVAKEPRSLPGTQAGRKSAAGSAPGNSTDSEQQSTAPGKSVTPAWAATSWSKHRAQGQAAAQKSDIWQDDTKPGVPSRLASGPVSQAGQVPQSTDDIVSETTPPASSSPDGTFEKTSASSVQVPPLVFPQDEASPAGAEDQETHRGRQSFGSIVSGALDAEQEIAPHAHPQDGPDPSVVVGDNLSISGKSRSGEIGHAPARSPARPQTPGGAGGEDLVVLEGGRGPSSKAVAGEIRPDESRQAISPGLSSKPPDEQMGAGTEFSVEKDRPGLVVEKTAGPTVSLEAGQRFVQAAGEQPLGRPSTFDERSQEQPEESLAATNMRAMADNGAEHGFFGEQDRHDEEDDFSDLDWTESKASGKRKWILLGSLCILVGGALGFWWYTKMDRYFFSPNSRVYGETNDRFSGEKKNIHQPPPLQRPTETQTPSRSVSSGQVPARERPARPPKGTENKIPARPETGAPARASLHSDRASPSGADIARAISDATKLLAKHRYRRVVELLERTVPGDLSRQGEVGKLLAKAYEKLAQRALDRNSLSKVVEYGRKAIKAESSRASPWFFVGYALHEQGKKAEARTYLKQYLTLCPKCQFSRWARRYLK